MILAPVQPPYLDFSRFFIICCIVAPTAEIQIAGLLDLLLLLSKEREEGQPGTDNHLLCHNRAGSRTERWAWTSLNPMQYCCAGNQTDLLSKIVFSYPLSVVL